MMSLFAVDDAAVRSAAFDTVDSIIQTMHLGSSERSFSPVSFLGICLALINKIAQMLWRTEVVSDWASGGLFDMQKNLLGTACAVLRVMNQVVADVSSPLSGKLLLIYICNFHVLSNLLLIYICKLHWNLNTMFSRMRDPGVPLAHLPGGRVRVLSVPP